MVKEIRRVISAKGSGQGTETAACRASQRTGVPLEEEWRQLTLPSKHLQKCQRAGLVAQLLAQIAYIDVSLTQFRGKLSKVLRRVEGFLLK